jgi:hypothetical protein
MIIIIIIIIIITKTITLIMITIKIRIRRRSMLNAGATDSFTHLRVLLVLTDRGILAQSN